MMWQLGLSLICLFCYGVDKWRAKRDAWRVPEKVLLLLPMLGGGIGGLLGMLLFRHKTRHGYFYLVNLLAIFMHGYLTYLAYTL